MKTVSILLALVNMTTLGACATYDMSTPEGVAAYQRDLDYVQAANARRAQEPGPIFVAPPPAGVSPIGPYGQPNNTAVVYCRDVTGNLIACKQIR